MNQNEKEMYTICSIILLVSFFGMVFLNFTGTNITGFVTLEELEDAEVKNEFVYEPPENITQETVLDALIKSEQDLEEMISFKIDTNFIKDTLLQAKRHFVGDNFPFFRDQFRKIDDALKQGYYTLIMPLYHKITSQSQLFLLNRL